MNSMSEYFDSEEAARFGAFLSVIPTPIGYHSLYSGGIVTVRTIPGTPPSLLFGFRLADAPAEGLQEPVSDLRVLLQERLEVPLWDRRHRDVRQRGARRASTLVIEQGHLAERVARTELPLVPGHGLHLDVAFGDDHEPDAALTADDDLVPGRVVHGLELLLA